MSAQAKQAKVLRIGIIQDGKIVQERLIKAGEDVTVGESAKNTFVFPKTSLPKVEFPLFVHKAGAYTLCFTQGMKGKISASGKVVGLQKLCADPSTNSSGGVYRLPLSDKDRGKISVDNVTVLFQFVPPPPTQAVKAMEGMDFRPRWFDEDDPAYYGFLALWAALAVIFSTFIYLAPPPPEMTFKDIEDRFAHVIDRQQKIEDDKPDEVKLDENVEPDREVEKKPEEKKPENVKPKKERTPEEIAKAQEARKEALKSRIKIARIGTRGRSSRGTTTDAYEDGVMSQLDGLEGTGVVVDGDPGLRSSDVETGDAQIGDLKAGDVGTSEGSSVGVDMSSYAVDAGSGDLSMLDDGAEGVESVVKSKSGQLNYCYETELKADPSLGGRVDLEWNVSNGRVTTVSVVGNTTGNAALGQCMVKKVKRWRFGPEVEGIVNWPFVFRKK